MRSERVLVALAGLAGGCGVALAAAASHVTGGGSAAIAADFLIVHAAVLLALAALAGGGIVHAGSARLAGFVLAAGLALFAGDLAMRAFYGVRLAPFAAPAGGFLLIAGWAIVVVAGLRRGDRR